MAVIIIAAILKVMVRRPRRLSIDGHLDLIAGWSKIERASHHDSIRSGPVRASEARGSRLS